MVTRRPRAKISYEAVKVIRHLRHKDAGLLARLHGVRRGHVCAVRSGSRWKSPPRPPLPLEERFWSKVDRSGGQEACWPWTAALRHGYGAFNIGGGRVLAASRVAWLLSNEGPISEGTHVCHECDNPPCCNPAHLYAGSAQDNMSDKVRRCAEPSARGVKQRRRRWEAYASYGGRYVYLGLFKTKDEAARVSAAYRSKHHRPTRKRRQT